jgi:hypothetical protein
VGGSEMREPDSYGKVPYTRVKAALTQIEEHYAECPERLEDLNITFEYLVGSFFPKIVENIDKRLNDVYTEGYLQGIKDGKEWADANQGNN